MPNSDMLADLIASLAALALLVVVQYFFESLYFTLRQKPSMVFINP